MKKIVFVVLLIGLLQPVSSIWGQTDNFTSVSVSIDFSKKLQAWDGFGINYVQATHTIDYTTDPQDNGGFHLLTEKQRLEMAELIFGDEGLRPALVKMFLDPLHQSVQDGPFDHKTSTTYMREFVRNGVELSAGRNDKLSIITTLFCPPGYTTKQKFIRGRDLDPAHKQDVANYMIDWVKFLRNEEKLPVDYISVHNEGEDWQRWPADGNESNFSVGHDYNMYWPREQVVDFLVLMRPMLDKAGLKNVGLTPGETTYWSKFYTTGYAQAIFDNKQAMKNLSLITSHGFYAPNLEDRWFGGPTNLGSELLQSERSDLHVWSTSSYFRWGVTFLKELHMLVYQSRVNGIIPWAFTKYPGTYDRTAKPIDILSNGTYKLTPLYYLYKQITRAGQPGTAVVQAFSMDTEIIPFGFSGNGTKHPDAIVVANNHDYAWKVSLEIKGAKSRTFQAYRSNMQGENMMPINPNIVWEKYKDVGIYTIENGRVLIELPAKSVITLFAK